MNCVTLFNRGGGRAAPTTLHPACPAPENPGLRAQEGTDPRPEAKNPAESTLGPVPYGFGGTPGAGSEVGVALDFEDRAALSAVLGNDARQKSRLLAGEAVSVVPDGQSGK
jgi:hypothetical protein